MQASPSYLYMQNQKGGAGLQTVYRACASICMHKDIRKYPTNTRGSRDFGANYNWSSRWADSLVLACLVRETHRVPQKDRCLTERHRISHQQNVQRGLVKFTLIRTKLHQELPTQPIIATVMPSYSACLTMLTLCVSWRSCSCSTQITVIKNAVLQVWITSEFHQAMTIIRPLSGQLCAIMALKRMLEDYTVKWNSYTASRASISPFPILSALNGWPY